jgi:hypothetical protein
VAPTAATATAIPAREYDSMSPARPMRASSPSSSAALPSFPTRAMRRRAGDPDRARASDATIKPKPAGSVAARKPAKWLRLTNVPVALSR